jgi:MFS family permease
MLQLLSIFILLILSAALIDKFSGLHRNISLLFLVQPLVAAAAPMMVFIAGLISIEMAPDPSLATLPLTLMIAGTAIATLPSAYLARNLGRRKGTMIGFSSGIIGGIVASLALHFNNFFLFSTSAFLMGIGGAFAQQLRFAAIESLSHAKDTPRAISLLMLTGIFAALIGPELAFAGKDWFGFEREYTGSFLGISLMSLLAILGVSFFKPLKASEETMTESPRPLKTIIKQPIFIVAIASGALGFGLMSFIMTATPLSMHNLHHHSLENTKWVIQSHVAAMYLPSLLIVWLGPKIHTKYILLTGSLVFTGVAMIASLGHELVHYWWALILLGVGWNFLFYSGTNLLPQSYKESEKHKVQGLNDFCVFTFQGLSSLMAGWVIFNHQWSGIIAFSIPFLVIMLTISLYYFLFSKKQNKQ